GGATTGSPYQILFNPAGVGNGIINTTAQDSGDTSPLYSYADTFSWSHGRHAWKIGGELRLTRSNGYNSTGGSVSPVATGGTSTGLDSSLAGTGNFTTLLPGFLQTARTASSNLLYFLNASVANAAQLYWIDNASDVKNG